MLTVFLVIAVAAFIVTVLSALNKAPLWISVILLCIIEMLRALPEGR